MTVTAPTLSLPSHLHIGSRRVHLAVMVLVALAVRLPYMPLVGSPSDFHTNLYWSDSFYEHGLGFYTVVQDVLGQHPPLVSAFNGLTKAIAELPFLKEPLLALGFDNVVRIKLPALIADLVLIGTVAYWLSDHRWLRWMIPAALALHPGLIASSVFWSQTDSVFTTFLVIAVLLISRDKPRVAWLIYTLAILTKFQAVVLFPLMVILTVRRYPLQRAILAPLPGAALFVGVYLLFVSANGWELPLRPYLGAVGSYSATTVNAYNLWMVIEPAYWEGTVGVVGPPDDNGWWLAPLNYFQLGLMLFVVFLLVMVYIMWRRARELREFVWGAALYFGFFMLPTQIHERYLYAGIVMSILAIAQDRRMIAAAAVSAWTYTFNIIGGLGAPYVWWGNQLRWLIGNVPPRIALVNTVLLAEVLLIVLTRSTPRWLQRGVYAVLAVIIVVVLVVPPPTREIPSNAQPIAGVTMAEGGELLAWQFQVEVRNFLVMLYWRANSAIYGEYVARVELEQEGEVIASTVGSPQDGENGTWRWFRGVTYPLAYYLYPTHAKSGAISIYLSIKPQWSDQFILLDDPSNPGARSERILIGVVPEAVPPEARG